MREADPSPNDEEPEILQSGTSDGKVLHLSEDDNDFILDVLDMVIERLSALEAVVQHVDSRLAGGQTKETMTPHHECPRVWRDWVQADKALEI